MATYMRFVTICQSCAMPMRKPDDFGTEANGRLNQEYCTHCFRDGVFTDPDMTLEQMTEVVAGIIKTEMGLPEASARGAAQASLLGLRRWQKY